MGQREVLLFERSLHYFTDLKLELYEALLMLAKLRGSF